MSVVDLAARERCRLMGHRWDEVDSGHWAATMGMPFTWRCEVCSMERRDTVGSNTGRLVTRRYLPADGYYYSNGDVRLNNDARRLLLVQTMVTQSRKGRRRSA